jgi:hypothetical protein
LGRWFFISPKIRAIKKPPKGLVGRNRLAQGRESGSKTSPICQKT